MLTLFSRNYEVLNHLLQDQSCRADLPNNLGDLAMHTVMKAELIHEGNTSIINKSKQLLYVLETLTERNKDVIIFVNNDGITPTDIAIMTGEIELLELFFRSKKL